LEQPEAVGWNKQNEENRSEEKTNIRECRRRGLEQPRRRDLEDKTTGVGECKKKEFWTEQGPGKAISSPVTGCPPEHQTWPSKDRVGATRSRKWNNKKLQVGTIKKTRVGARKRRKLVNAKEEEGGSKQAPGGAMSSP
jgi:hypothetical protein